MFKQTMKTLLLTLAVCWLAFISGAAPVEGVIRLEGVPPPEISIQMSADCAQAQLTAPTTRHYVTGKDGGLANVFVVMRSGLEGRKFTPSTNPVLMNCVACQIQPVPQ